ncbi:MAG TPA: ferredoxin family protein [Planctomycetota bacterium]|nr:ferredoxin family protein [Planctomycetota bacterium]
MTAAAASRPLRVVLHEGKGGRRLSAARRLEILRALLKKGYAVTCSNGGGDIAPADGSDIVCLIESGGASADGEDATAGVRVHLRDITGAEVDGVIGIVEDVRQDASSYLPGQWKPWFPVIDFGRCTNCMQCLSFCLFDVYGVDVEKNIQVKNPDKCKTNCPACSRVCPEVAILFPKYNAGPINGADVNVEDVAREKMKIDISALLGGDIYSLLRERHKRAESRFSKERDEGKALKERLRCMEKLKDQMEIPPEVLMALPSLDQIRRKAEEASRTAREALEARQALETPRELPGSPVGEVAG